MKLAKRTATYAHAPKIRARKPGQPVGYLEEVRRSTILSRLQLWTLFQIYGAPGCTNEEVAELCGAEYNASQHRAWLLRNKGLILSTHTTSKTGEEHRYEHECTKKGAVLVEAWVQFLQKLGPSLCREMYYELSDWA